MAPAIIIITLALLYPLGYMVYGSFRAWDPSQNISESEFVGLKNYITLFYDPAFRESLVVTLTFAICVVFSELVIGVGLALMLDRNIRGMSVLRTLFILPMMIAPVVVGLMWRYMYHPTVGTFNKTLKSFGLDGIDWLGQNALLSVIIADIWQWTPFIFILSLAALQSLPRSALEAAKIDGATSWQQIIHIKLPLMMPVLIVTALLRLIDAFKVLEVILVMTEGGPGLSTEILALRISRTASEFRELGVAAAMSNYLLIILLILTVSMYAITRIQENRAARLARQIQEEY
jgi:multiple sugar transport system permease protein|tara:strand:+ start:7545 stop:8414 length:870 start_codon:yes stop_codon:yes gene_type:complete